MSWNIAKPGDQINGPVAVTGNLNVDSNTLFVDSANNRVGVLTASPTVPLDVIGDAKVSGNLTVDTNTLVVDAANNRLGIGTATPSVALDVNGSAYFRASSAILGAGTPFEWISTYPNRTQAYQSSGNDFEINNISSGGFRLYLNSTERLRIASDGVCTWSNVGGVAGTAMTLNGTGLGVGVSPATKLHIAGTGTQTLKIQTNTSGNPTLALEAAGQDGASMFFNRSGNYFGIGVSGIATAVAINTSGNVGIGTTSPNQKFVSAGPRSYFAGDGALYAIGVGSTAARTATNEVYYIGATNSATPDLVFTNAYAVEGMRITHSGNLGLGTSTANFRADIQNASGAAVLRLKGGTGAAQGSAVYMTYAGGANTLLGIGDRATILGGTPDQLACIYSGVALTFEISGAERLRLKTTGQVNFVGLASDPAGAAAGDVYYNTTTNKLKCYNGTTWNDLF